MKYKITKFYNGSIEFIYGDKSVILTDKNPTIELTEQEFKSIPKHKQYLILNKFVVVEFIEEEVKKNSKN